MQGSKKPGQIKSKTQKTKNAPTKRGIVKKCKTKQEALKREIKKQCVTSMSAVIESEMVAKMKKDGKPLHVLAGKADETPATTKPKKSTKKKTNKKK